MVCQLVQINSLIKITIKWMQEGLQLYHKLLKKLLEQNQDLHYIKTIIFSRPLVPEIKMNLETKVNQL